MGLEKLRCFLLDMDVEPTEMLEGDRSWLRKYGEVGD